MKLDLHLDFYYTVTMDRSVSSQPVFETTAFPPNIPLIVKENTQ